MQRLHHTQLWLHVSVLLLFIAGGCATSPKRIARYIEKHPERPENIQTSLQQNLVVVGMTPKEVRLSLGTPNRVSQSGTGANTTETWFFFRQRKKTSSLNTSPFWSFEVPKATIYFSSEELVDKVSFYEVTHTETTQQPPQTTPQNEKLNPEPLRYTPTPAELHVKGWPTITLGGISTMGSNRSAVLNDSVLAPGEIIKGVTVTKVFANGVLLEYRGARAFLHPGESTH